MPWASWPAPGFKGYAPRAADPRKVQGRERVETKGRSRGIGPSVCFGRCGEAGEVEEERTGRCGVWFGRRV